MNSSIDFSETRVLIIDDEEFMRIMVRRLLKNIGVTNVSEAADGADGLTKLTSDPPDLIILDIMMEPMNGLKFLKMLRTGMSGAPRDLPVVVITGSAEQAVFGTAMKLDCNAFVRKGDGQDAIQGRMARVLDETTEIKEAGAYLTVNIPDITITAPAGSRPPPSAPPATKAYEVPIEDVEPGAVVARDVVTENGDVLLEEGTVISASYLGRLQDISEIIDLPYIWVEM